MIGRGIIDTSYKEVIDVNLNHDAETTLEDTHILNSDVKKISSKSKTSKQNTPTDAKTDLHLSTEHMPTDLEKLVTSNLIEDNISVCDFKTQVM